MNTVCTRNKQSERIYIAQGISPNSLNNFAKSMEILEIAVIAAEKNGIANQAAFHPPGMYCSLDQSEGVIFYT